MADDDGPLGVVGWMLAKNRHGFVRPRPVHTMTPGAEAAVDALRAFAAANPVTMVDGKAKRVPVTPPELGIVGPLPPWVEAPVSALDGAPARFALDGLKALRPVRALVAGDAVEVRVKTDAGTIRAWWKAGRTTGVVAGGRKVTLTEAKGML